jgi:hypothetical protein
VLGIAEYGLLLNRYLNVLDATREAARYTANFNPFCPLTSTDPLCPPGTVTPDYYQNTADLAEQVLYPVVLEPTRNDDIVISFFVVSGGHVAGRYPTADGQSGWSWSEHKLGYLARNHDSLQTSTFIDGRLTHDAPDVSVSLVEVFYDYPQTLKLVAFLQFVPDPIPVYAYAIMPIKNITPPP